MRAVGSNDSRRIDVRVVAATNRDLRMQVERGEFRQDLYYRLNVIPIVIPPLRDRPDDIVPLAEFFLERHGARDREFGRSAIDALRKFGWPGNARELENVVERAIALTDEVVIEAESLNLQDESFGWPGDDALESLVEKFAESGAPLRSLEDRYITAVLRSVDGNKNRAAKILGINRATLYRRQGSDS